MSVITVNELDVWDGELESYNMDATTASLEDGITDLTNVEDLESSDEIKLDYFQIPGLLIKSFFLIITAILTIPFTGLLLAAYGVHTSICAMVEVFNLLMVAIALSQYASNRRITQ
jgi:hypothetical protein